MVADSCFGQSSDNKILSLRCECHPRFLVLGGHGNGHLNHGFEVGAFNASVFADLSIFAATSAWSNIQRCSTSSSLTGYFPPYISVSGS